MGRQQSMLPSLGSPALCVFLATHEALCICFRKLLLLFTTLPCSSRSFSCYALQATSPQPVPGTLNTRHTFCLQNLFSASLVCVAQAPRVTLFNTCASTILVLCPPVFSLHRPPFCRHSQACMTPVEAKCLLPALA